MSNRRGVGCDRCEATALLVKHPKLPNEWAEPDGWVTMRIGSESARDLCPNCHTALLTWLNPGPKIAASIVQSSYLPAPKHCVCLHNKGEHLLGTGSCNHQSYNPSTHDGMPCRCRMFTETL